jgi:AcrR family transcriptional regulator
VAETITAAGSGRASFERHFADKQECFLAAHGLLAERALEAIRPCFEGKRRWPEQACEGLARAVELCTEEPALARALVVCPVAAGAEGQQRKLALIGRFAELAAPPAELAERLPPRAGLMAVSGVVGLIGEELGRGAAADLAGLEPELGFALLAPLLGPEAAGEELERAAALAAATS